MLPTQFIVSREATKFLLLKNIDNEYELLSGGPVNVFYLGAGLEEREGQMVF